MKWLITLSLSLASLVAVLFWHSESKPTQPKLSNHHHSHAKQYPTTQAKRIVSSNEIIQSVGLDESQTRQYQQAMVLFGQQRKKLLQQRKDISKKEYRLNLAAIKARLNKRLMAIMGRRHFDDYQEQLANNRQIRRQLLTEHTHQHKFERRYNRRKVRE